MTRKRYIFMGMTLALVLIAAGVARLALQRGPHESEIRTFVLSDTRGAADIVILRNDMDATGTIWLDVQMSDGTSEERGYEFVERWVWPWQSYFDVDQRLAGT